ncbi:MAG: hypothetical protein V1801_02415 [Candidatus Falkowbacteria bacterium]
MASIEKNYTLKILILFLATSAGIFAIWYALMRDESVDWLSSQIVHQASPYVMTETEDGLFVSNVLLGYGFNLPEDFKTTGSKNLSFFMEEAGEKKCEIKHSVVTEDTANKFMPSNSRAVISLRELKFIFELANTAEQDVCGKYLEEIKNIVFSD